VSRKSGDNRAILVIRVSLVFTKPTKRLGFDIDSGSDLDVARIETV